MLTPENLASSLPLGDRFNGELVLAVDSGGTKTSCTLARIGADRQWTILGTGGSSAGNPRAVGLEASVKAICQSVKSATAEAGLDSFPCHRAVFAVAGTLHEPIRRDLCRRLTEMELAEECFVVPDLIPLVVGCGSSISIGLIAGTGSVAIGRDSSGNYAVSGGWGPLLGDDGSGFAIGRAALRVTLSSLESGKKNSGLVQQVCVALGARSSQEIKTMIAGTSDLRELVASLAPIVLSVANHADPLCVAITKRAAADLAEIIQSLQARMKIPPDGMNIALSGGVLQADSPVTHQLAKELSTRGFQAKLDRIDDPVLPILNMLAQPELPRRLEILP
ncbi:BadF/BadG/BcrA/BcrD ATPase family protein [Bremerella volcania]|uniref:BadF/BadG/BcrA/BcrD ATPase family protein n=1 Tax=Bremerella volcania TaxID=2527984 RepID=A0A518C8T0_9BACT|nr:BadF/BadG/BcrA/BcrD ATPase family protein [Bremerella volcania]QDU75620.1 BadF/BadG/BcrA/BcrD ATPase family protein [Bremerella volcania]